MKGSISIMLVITMALMLVTGCGSATPAETPVNETPANETPVGDSPSTEIEITPEPEPEATPTQEPAPPTETPAPEQAEPSGTGTATADAIGFGGRVKVTVTVNEGKITDLIVEGSSETDGIGSRAVKTLPAAIVEQNGLEIDAVSGATITSEAIFKACRLAFAQIAENN